MYGHPQGFNSTPDAPTLGALRAQQSYVPGVGRQIMTHDPLMIGMTVGVLAPAAVVAGVASIPGVVTAAVTNPVTTMELAVAAGEAFAGEAMAGSTVVGGGVFAASRSGLLDRGMEAVEAVASRGEAVASRYRAMAETAEAERAMPYAERIEAEVAEADTEVRVARELSATPRVNAMESTAKLATDIGFPPNNGFWGQTENVMLKSGELIDRYGGTGLSRFFSPAGTPVEARALPPGVAKQPLRTFRVVRPFEVESGTVAPWYGQRGLGTQFRSPLTLDELLSQGFLKEVAP